MSVLEICELQVKPEISPNDPAILKRLIEVRSALKAKVVNTNSKFYQCIEEPMLIYILGVWPSISSHNAFLDSPQKSEILSPQVDLLDFNWMVHVPFSDMSCLPLDAHVMSIARLGFKSGANIVEYQRVLNKHRQKIVEASKPHKMVDRWRCDGESGTEETFIFTGWQSVEAHEEFTASAMEDPEYASVKYLSKERAVKHVRNMEAS